MPNHVTNIVQSGVEVIASMLVDGRPDFNAIIPMPNCLRGFEPNSDVVDRAKCAMGAMDFKGPFGGLESLNAERAVHQPIKPQDIDAVITAIRCYQQTGHVYWYDWSIANWGTKWNAYSSEADRCSETQMHFETAWSMPEKVAIVLSEKFPAERIVWQYADEDTGSNCGTIVLQGGKVIERDCAGRWDDMSADERRKWTRFAFMLSSPCEDPKEHGYDESFNRIEE